MKIFNWRGIKEALFKIMNSCYQNNYKLYDWLIFYELDEFVHLLNYTNIKLFLNEKKFNKFRFIEREYNLIFSFILIQNFISYLVIIIYICYICYIYCTVTSFRYILIWYPYRTINLS